MIIARETHLWCELELEVGDKHGNSGGHIHARQLLPQAIPQALPKWVESPHLPTHTKFRTRSLRHISRTDTLRGSTQALTDICRCSCEGGDGASHAPCAR